MQVGAERKPVVVGGDGGGGCCEIPPPKMVKKSLNCLASTVDVMICLTFFVACRDM